MPYPKKQLVKTYVLDWALCIVFLIIFKCIDLAGPYHRRFSLENKTIQYPYAVSERVPMWAAFLIAVVFPLVVITIISLAIKRNMHDWHHAILGLLLSLSLNLVVTQTFKSTVGRPRPDFIDRCQPVNGSADALIYGLSTSDICTQTDQSILQDGFKSFLSGHASTSFAGLAYLSLYLAGKLHVWDRKGHTYKAFVVVMPLVVATLIAVSRTMDYRHHWQDVIAGSITGSLIAFFSYHQYFPALYSHACHNPFSIRLKEPEPEYNADFSFEDGSTFKIRVTRNGETVHQSNNKLLGTPEELNQV